MTIQGAIAELQNLLEVDDVPSYYKGGIEKVIETIQMELAARKTEPQIFIWGKEVHKFCKMKCNESKARLFDGDRFIVCGQSNDAICISLPACPLGKWITGKGYHILPMDEPQTERSE